VLDCSRSIIGCRCDLRKPSPSPAHQTLCFGNHDDDDDDDDDCAVIMIYQSTLFFSLCCGDAVGVMMMSVSSVCDDVSSVCDDVSSV